MLLTAAEIQYKIDSIDIRLEGGNMSYEEVCSLVEHKTELVAELELAKDEEDDHRDDDEGQPTEYEEWQDYMGGDDWDHGQYDEAF